MAYFDDRSQLISALFAAAAGGGAGEDWPAFLQLLARQAQADGAALQIFLPEGPQPAPWRAGHLSLPNAVALAPLRADRVYAQDEVSPAHPAPLRLIKARLPSPGAVQGPGQGEAVLALGRAPHRQDFRSIDAQHLSALAPFLGQAVGQWRRLRQAQDLRDAQAGLLTGLGVAWLIVDAVGTILAQSGALAHWGPDLGSAPRLRARLEPGDALLAQQLRRAMAALLGDQAPPFGCVVARPGLPALLLRAQPYGGQRAVIVLMRQPPKLADLDIVWLAHSLGLSRSEARLAAVLGDGVRLKQAATQLGWTEETARSCSKAIYAKLGVHGQAGLLRHLHGAGLWPPAAAGDASDIAQPPTSA